MSRLVATAASGALREDHYVLNSVSGLYERSTLLELTRTNICLQSQTFNTTWSPTTATVSANADVAPDGTATADRLIEDSSAATTHRIGQAVTITADASVALSCYVKAGTRSFVQLRLSETASASNQFRATFNLSTGVAGTATAGGTGASTRTGTEALANGWHRCWTVGSVGNGATAVTLEIFIGEADDDVTFDGNGSGYISLWGAQVENVAAFPTSYITTTTVSVARAADALSYPFTLTPQEMTVYVKFVERGTVLDATSGSRVIHIGAADNSNPRFIIFQNSNLYRAHHETASGAVTSTQAVAPAYGDTVELRGVLSLTGVVTLGQSINNAAETVAASSAALALGATWSGELLWLNSVAAVASSVGANAFLSVKIARGTKTMAEMRLLASMETSVLVLNAGDADAITVQCQSADKMEKEDVGTVSRAFAGNLRVSTRDQKRAFQVVTSYLTAAEELAIQALIADNAPIPCSGILLDNDTIDCVVKCQRSSLVQGTELWEMSLSLAEV